MSELIFCRSARYCCCCFLFSYVPLMVNCLRLWTALKLSECVMWWFVCVREPHAHTLAYTHKTSKRKKTSQHVTTVLAFGECVFANFFLFVVRLWFSVFCLRMLRKRNLFFCGLCRSFFGTVDYCAKCLRHA